MSYGDRLYDVYVILGHPQSVPAWVEPVWSKIATEIDPLILAARGSAAVRSCQLRLGAGSPNQRGISFGRIGWHAPGHRKWVHTTGNDEDRVFVSSDIWAPSWTTCDKEKRPPDTFICLRNEMSTTVPGQDKFNATIIMAVAADQGAQVTLQGRTSAKKIAVVTKSVLCAHQCRAWSYPIGNIFRTNSICDLSISGLFKPGPRHKRDISLSTLNGEWQSLDA